MRRILVAAYGCVGYLAFLLTIGYLAAFLADIAVPKTVDRGVGPLGPALLVDLAILAAFGLQHSAMARPAFKRWTGRWIPPGLERTTYSLASGVALALLFWLWRPIPAVLWDAHGTPLEELTWLGYATGWAVAVWATFAISHFHFVGVRQSAAHALGKLPPALVLRTSALYRAVRHPMTAGLLLAFWSTPRMTVGHLLFAAGMTTYCLLATVLEERDLLRSFPEQYRRYRQEVPALIPFLRPGRRVPAGSSLATELGTLALAMITLSLWLLPTSVRVTRAPDYPDLVRQEVTSGSHLRRFAVVESRRDNDLAPRPLVLALHGTGGSADRLQAMLGGELERAARQRGWVVAYPEALGGAWNDCRGASRAPAPRDVDDVDFLRHVIAWLVEHRGVDPTRVFLLGYSGGGHMAFRVALESPDLARGIAVFAANLPVKQTLACGTRAGTTAMMLVNGSRDLVNPSAGGDVASPTGVALGPVRSTEETGRFFRERGSEVVLITLPDGGHSVPGTASRFPRAVGPTARAFEGIEQAMRFFGRQLSSAEHGKPPPALPPLSAPE
jgi:methanethiol S-methyltransferase